MGLAQEVKNKPLTEFAPPLDAAWVSSFDFITELDVRYCETDGARHVNHVAVPAYLEHGLLKLLRHLGDTRHADELAFEHWTVELLVRYIAPSVFGETLRIGSKVVHVGRSSAAIEQVVLGGGDGTVRVAARTIVVRTSEGLSAPWTFEQRACLVSASRLPSGPRFSAVGVSEDSNHAE
jgi:acyl-CoA thioesterase FadM